MAWVADLVEGYIRGDPGAAMVGAAWVVGRIVLVGSPDHSQCPIVRGRIVNNDDRFFVRPSTWVDDPAFGKDRNESCLP